MALYDITAYQETDASGNQQQRRVSDEILSSAPTTGTTVSPSYTLGRNSLVALTPAGTLAALTVSLPSSTLNTRKKVTISTSKILTSFTVTAVAGSIVTPSLTTLALGGFVVFQSDGTNWLRVG